MCKNLLNSITYLLVILFLNNYLNNLINLKQPSLLIFYHKPASLLKQIMLYNKIIILISNNGITEY